MPGIDTDNLFPPSFSGPTSETAFTGVSVPFANLTMAWASDQALTIVVTGLMGKLYADPALGATVSGGGSSSVWIAGTAAQVNAKLATLVYGAGPAGTDTLSISLLDSAGGVAAVASIPVTVLPFISGAPASISVSEGTLTLDTRTLDGVTLALSQPVGDLLPASLVLITTRYSAPGRRSRSGPRAEPQRPARTSRPQGTSSSPTPSSSGPARP